jgi:predicted Zn finger-like uncharacterized protein
MASQELPCADGWCRFPMSSGVRWVRPLCSRPVDTDGARFFQICEPKFGSKSAVNSASRGTKKFGKKIEKIDGDRGTVSSRHAYRGMKKSDLTCPECGAGYRRIELDSKPGNKGKYRCLVCDHVLEVFDGSKTVAIRLTVKPAPPSFS